MKTKTETSLLLHTLVAILAIAAGYVLDLASVTLRGQAAETFQFMPSVVFNLLLPIVIVLIFLGLVWYLYRYLSQSRPAAYFYLAIGLIGILAYVSIFVPALPFLRIPIVQQFRTTVAQFGFGSAYYLISSFLLVFGIAGSMRKER